ncbi:MAG: M24 family metallopeptidase, partial [Candidatus Omnitrophica bacterium]|nr:M24 family metallopeptidase [Candidatus Omnitrophota bacterium]
MGLNFLGPLARTVFPNIKAFGFGEKFQAITYGLEGLGIPAAGKLHQDSKGFSGFLNGKLRNFAHMAWSGTREEVFDEQISGLVIGLIPGLTAQTREILQELVNDGPNIRMNAFTSAKETLQALVNGGSDARILEVSPRDSLGFKADQQFLADAAALQGKNINDIKDSPQLLRTLADLAEGARITIGFSVEAVNSGRININQIHGKLAGQNYEVTYEVGEGWKDAELNNNRQNEFHVWAEAAQMKLDLEGKGFTTPDQQFAALKQYANKTLATVDSVTTKAIDKLLVDTLAERVTATGAAAATLPADVFSPQDLELLSRGTGRLDQSQLLAVMATAKMIDPSYDLSFGDEATGKISISLDALINRRAYDRDFDSAIRQIQADLGFYSGKLERAFSLSKGLAIDGFNLTPPTKTEWAESVNFKLPAFQAVNVFSADHNVAYMQSGQDLLADLANRSASAFKSFSARRATEQAYGLVGAADMGLLGKGLFHSLGFLHLGKKQELRNFLRQAEAVDPRTARDLNQLAEQILALQRKSSGEELASDSDILDKLGIASERQAKEKLKELEKKQEQLLKTQAGKGKLKLGEIYEKLYNEQMLAQARRGIVSSHQARQFVEANKVKYGITEEEYQQVLEALAKARLYDHETIFEALKPYLDKFTLIDMKKRSIAKVNELLGSNSSIILKEGDNVIFEIVRPGRLRNEKRGGAIVSSQARLAYKRNPDGTYEYEKNTDGSYKLDSNGHKIKIPITNKNGKPVYEVAIDPSRNFHLSIDSVTGEVILRSNTTGEYNFGKGAHELIHIALALLKDSPKKLTGRLREVALALAREEAKEEMGEAAMSRLKLSEEDLLARLDIDLGEMGHSEKITIEASMKSFVEGGVAMSLETDDPMLRMAAEMAFRGYPQEQLATNLFELVAQAELARSVHMARSWVDISYEGDRSGKEDGVLGTLKEIHQQAKGRVKQETDDLRSLRQGLNSTYLWRLYVEEVQRLAEIEGLAVRINQRLSSLSVGSDTAMMDKWSDAAVRDGNQILLDVVLEAKGQVYDGAYSWTAGREASPNLLREYARVKFNTILDRLESMVNDQDMTWAEADYFMRKEMEKAGLGKFGYWQKKHTVSVEEGFHSFLGMHHMSGRKAEGRIRHKDVISVEPGYYLPGIFGVREERTFVVNKTPKAREPEPTPTTPTLGTAASPVDNFPKSSSRDLEFSQPESQSARLYLPIYYHSFDQDDLLYWGDLQDQPLFSGQSSN